MLMLDDIDSNSLIFWRRMMKGWELQCWEALKEDIRLIRLSNSEELLSWNKDTGQFTIQKCYSMLENGINIEGPWSVIWKLKVPNKVKLFVWKICHRILPTRARLTVRLKREIQACLFCHEGSETIDHLFWSCPRSKELWRDLFR